MQRHFGQSPTRDKTHPKDPPPINLTCNYTAVSPESSAAGKNNHGFDDRLRTPASAELYTSHGPSSLYAPHISCRTHQATAQRRAILPAFQLPAQEPKLVSGAKISDATQVMQREPRSNINEKRFGKEPKTVDQARRGVPVPVGHTLVHTNSTP